MITEAREVVRPAPSPWSDTKVDQWIGRLLQAGVLAAAAVVLAGAVALLARSGGAPADFRHFRPERSTLDSLAPIVRGALRLDSAAVVQLGLVLLIATPVARVALTVVVFVLKRDRLYVAITLLVLCLLLYGLLWGRA